jgi:hypothetical protein
MSEILLIEYAVFFVAQTTALIVVYLILRFKTKLRVSKTLCLSVLIVSGLTLFLLPLNFRFIFGMNPTDLKEYVAGTLIVAIPFMLILFIQLLMPWLKEIGSESKATGPERARILRMIEEGKVTSEEGSDLLEAMGRSNAMRGQDRFSLLDMVILCGVAFVITGFFLPWVYIRSSAYQTGHQIGALGWTIFITALVSIVPVFITPKNFLYKISIFHLFLSLLGLLLVLITLFRAGSHFGIGIIACIVGFMIELIASGVKFKRLAA